MTFSYPVKSVVSIFIFKPRGMIDEQARRVTVVQVRHEKRPLLAED